MKGQKAILVQVKNIYTDFASFGFMYYLYYDVLMFSLSLLHLQAAIFLLPSEAHKCVYLCQSNRTDTSTPAHELNL